MAFLTSAGQLVNGIFMREPSVQLGPLGANWSYNFFLTGTSTPANVYQDANLSVPFSPTGVVTANAVGTFPPIYLDGSVTYKVVTNDATGTPIPARTYDPYVAPIATTGTSQIASHALSVNAQGEFGLTVAAGGVGVALTVNAPLPAGAGIRVYGSGGAPPISINTSATTGAQTATFTATNKPGIATSGPTVWLPLLIDGVVMYTPLWRGDNYIPVTPPPTVQGQVITAATVAWGSNGSTTLTGTGAHASPTSWYVPNTVGIGSSFWLNITKTGGLSGQSFSQAQGAWVQISTLSAISTVGGNTLSGTYQISSNSGGTNIVASGTIALSGNNGPQNVNISGTAPVVFAGNGGLTLNGASLSNWYLPTTTNIGSSYWLNITRTGGTSGVNFTAAQGAWTSITNSGLSITLSNSTGSATVTGSYQISNNVGGTLVQSTGTISLTHNITTLLRVYSSGSSATETIPSGYTTVRMECWAAGGGGSAGTGTGCAANNGTGGAAGGYSRSQYTISAIGGAGKTFIYTVGTGGTGGFSGGASGAAGGTSFIHAGTVTGFTAMNSNGGGGGTNASGASGGTASGGNQANTTGGSVASRTENGATGTSGVISGDGSPHGGGGSGGILGTGSSGSVGANGYIVFYYS